MRIAFFHLDLSGGPEERNLAWLSAAIHMAAEQGADWIITPETAVQGYFFAQRRGAMAIPVQPGRSLQPIRQLAAERRLTVFLGCAEQDEVTGKFYNSCLVIGPDGRILGRHRKLRTHGGAEGWSSKGDRLEPVVCADATVGILVCADIWYSEHSRVLKDKGAELIVVPAAWPPGNCGPGDCWEQCSARTGLPVWICNQTGSGEELDFSQAQSAVVVNGKTRLSYSGQEEAVLMFDWDCGKQCLLSPQFTVIAVNPPSPVSKRGEDHEIMHIINR